MFKKYGLNFGAVALAIFTVIISSIASVQRVNAEPTVENFYWQLNDPTAPLQASSYSAINVSTYNGINCLSGSKVCKLRSSSSSLPSSMMDSNADNIPDITGVVTAAPTKN